MKYIVNNIRLTLDDDIEILKSAAAKKLRVSRNGIKNFKIIKESVDARKKSEISLVYSVIAELDGEVPLNADIREVETRVQEELKQGNTKLSYRPIIVGSGPAGLFAGLVLAQKGYRPLILERGQSVEKRVGIVKKYWEKGELDLQTNVQFGEGGAGTFSDGKLTTRINDGRCDAVLQEFYLSGAPEEILYKSKPHIGTDRLRHVVSEIRKRITALGGEVRFGSRVESLLISGERVSGVVVNGSEEIRSEIVVLAVGHSARDTFSSLLRQGVVFERKPFSIGVRIEHPQGMINTAQYGRVASHPRLGQADYQLFYKTSGRTVYSFCMCPGGIVVASASERDTIVTNGMSEFSRGRENANSAMVVSVEPKDFEGSHPLSGIEFQRIWEKLAFGAGGMTGAAPVQRLEDFIEGRKSAKLGEVKASYTGPIAMSDINTCLPDFVTTPMKEAIGDFDRKLRGFGMKDAVLTGVETRTSSPVRIPRDEKLESTGLKGLYPAGEGAGYAGGIMSAAVDGIRVAEQIVRTYTLPVDG